MGNAKSVSVKTSYHPDVFISKRKNRLRVYHGNTIYLNDGDEFELEFDNSTRMTWLAKIKLNGEWVSESGLVLRPGEHIFLDTPDLNSYEKRRFRFETYSIEKGRTHLVEDNGLVEIYFYKQQQYIPHWLNHPPKYRWTWNRWDWTGPRPQIWYSSSGTTGGYYRTTTIKGDNEAINCNNNMEETGRIEKGSKSDQDFVNSYENFEYYNDYIEVYKILPISKKPNTVQDIRKYCLICGRRRRKGENYCSKCGNKF